MYTAVILDKVIPSEGICQVCMEVSIQKVKKWGVKNNAVMENTVKSIEIEFPRPLDLKLGGKQ